jgi:hypothetical protein
MSLHYQVTSTFAFMHSTGRPSLIGLTLNSTFAACTSWPNQPNQGSFLTQARIFSSLKDAQSYIAYLQRIYKRCAVPPPVLDSGQLNLF